MSKNLIIKGTLILTIAGFLTKLLGFYNRIFLTRVIGVKELGIYQLIFPIYILIISFCCQGVSTTITKHVSYYLGKREDYNAKAAFKLGLIISLTLSTIFMIILASLSHTISLYILKNSDCGPLLRTISLALPFVAIKSCINAYFIGSDNPGVHGLSHFIEQLVRVITAYFLTYIVITDNYNASLATISVVSGEVFSGFLSIIIIVFETKSKKPSDTYIKKYMTRSDYSISQKIGKPFLLDAIPITVNNLVFTLFASLEAIILPAMLYKYYGNSNDTMELYGCITGIVIPFLLFPATITTALSTMLLPAMSGAKARNNYNKIKSAIFLCVSFCLVLGVVAYLGYLFLGQWACEFAFDSLQSGIILKKMCFLCPLIYISGVLSTILNGLDKAFNNMIINVCGLIVRIIFIICFVPNHGFTSYVTGMFMGYVTMLALMGITIKKALKQNP